MSEPLTPKEEADVRRRSHHQMRLAEGLQSVIGGFDDVIVIDRLLATLDAARAEFAWVHGTPHEHDEDGTFRPLGPLAARASASTGPHR